MDTAKYQYEPLASANTIRLVELQAAGATVGDCLWQGDLDSVGCPSYEALSYTWGVDVGYVSISQDGVDKRVKASNTLQPIMDSLRLPNRVRRLWIDAVCINQDDIPERNVVVPRMRDIYSHAVNVVICLGEARFCSEFIPLTILAINQSILNQDHESGFAKLDERMQHIIKTQPQPSNYLRTVDDRWQNLRSWLYDRKWFARMWVIQEAAVARHSVIHCGEWEVPGPIFFQTLGLFGRFALPPSIADIEDGYDWGVAASLQQLSLMRGLGAGEPTVRPLPLMELLKRSHFNNATDPHDHIYALLGLTSDVDLPRVDYGEPWQETYKKFAVRLIEGGHLAEILQSCSFYPDDEGLPSWVPDWRPPSRYSSSKFAATRIPYHTPGVNVAWYRAGGDKQPVYSIQDNLLQVRGATIMVIERLGKGFGGPAPWDPPDVASKIILKALEEIQEFAQEMSKEKDVVDLLSWNTLICGQHWDVNRRFDGADFETCYAWVARHYKLLDTEFEAGQPSPIPGSTRGQQMISRLAFEEYKPWNRVAPSPPPADNKQRSGSGLVKLFTKNLRRTAKEDSQKEASQGKGTWGPPPLHEMRRFERKALGFTTRYRRCVTAEGLLGQVPLQASEGDMIALFEGIPVPLLLRHQVDAYQVIGACYFTSFMDGQAAGSLDMSMIPLA